MTGSYILCNKLRNNGLMTDWGLCESIVDICVFHSINRQKTAILGRRTTVYTESLHKEEALMDRLGKHID